MIRKALCSLLAAALSSLPIGGAYELGRVATSPPPTAVSYGYPTFLGTLAQQTGGEQTTIGTSLTAVTFSGNAYDTTSGAIHSTGTKLTAKWNGIYFAWGNASVVSINNGTCVAALRKNGSNGNQLVQNQLARQSSTLQWNVSGFFDMSAGDYVELCLLGISATSSTKTAADSNTQCGLALIATRDGVGRSSAYPVVGGVGSLGVAQSITNNTWSVINYDTTKSWHFVNPSSIHSNSSNKSRWNCPYSGYYLHMASDFWDQNTTGDRLCGFGTNQNASSSPTLVDVDCVGGLTNGGALPAAFSAGIQHQNAGDYLEFFVKQNSGGSLNVRTNAGTMFTLIYLGEGP